MTPDNPPSPPAKTRYVVWVDFTLDPAQHSEFMQRLTVNARDTLQEPGCRRFDVLVPEKDRAAALSLYEIYDSREAFDAHLKSPHFLAFRDATSSMVTGSVVRTFLLPDAG